MTVEIQTFKRQTNQNILNAIRKNASPDYQRRIPDSTKANIQSNMNNLLQWRPAQNEFIDALINQIGLIIYKGLVWSNPLAEFKRGMLEFGDTIEEINAGLIQAKVYQVDRDALEGEIFGTELPDVQTSFHKIDRQNYYKLSINETMLRRAFQSEYGLSDMVAQLMSTPLTSDSYDEFLATTSLFGEYYRAGGFFKVQISDLADPSSTPEDAKYALRRMREYAGILKFPSTHYNASGMPVAANSDELLILISPGAMAALDVEALAGAFNIAKADMPGRIIVIPDEYWNIPGAQFIVTTKDFFVIADTFFGTTNAFNPVTMVTNYFLHHHQIISASRFVPALLFTTEPGSVIEIVETPVTGITAPVVYDENGNVVTSVERGELYQIATAATTTPVGGDNDAVRFVLRGNNSPHTHLYQTGSLAIGLDETARSISVDVYAVDTDVPQTETTLTLAVTGDLLTLWPTPEVTPDADNDGLLEVTPEPVPAAPTSGASKNKVTIPETEGVDYKDGATVVSGQTITLTANKTITAVAQTGFELAPGAVASWPLVYTA